MELILIKDGVWEVVCDDLPVNQSAAWKRKDDKARANIGLLVDDKQFIHIKKAISAKESWNILKNRHEKPTLSNKISLLKRICNLKMEESDDMESHVNEMNDLVEQLTNLGEELKENLVVAMLLRSLPDSYDTLINVLENKPEDELTVEFIVGKLVDEFKKRMETKSHLDNSNENSIFKISNGRRQFQGNCTYCQKFGHVRASCFAYKKYLENAKNRYPKSEEPENLKATESANAIEAEEDDGYEYLF